MGKNYQMIRTSEDNVIMIVDYVDGELSFRSSRNPEHRQKEKVVIEDDIVYVGLYNFHITYLNKFLNENK